MISIVVSFLQKEFSIHPYLTISLSLLLIALSYLASNEIVRFRARISGFKGPRGLPIIGNLEAVRVNAAEQYRKWAKTYGDVYQIQLGNIPVIVVNSAESARKIFGTNSQSLSSRPVFYTFHKVLLLQYNSSTTLTWISCRCFQIPQARQ